MGFLLIAGAVLAALFSKESGGKEKRDTRDYWTKMKEDESYLYNAYKIEANNRYDELGRRK